LITKEILGRIGMVFTVKIELSKEIFLHFLGWKIRFMQSIEEEKRKEKERTDSILAFLLL
jgi:hypothetical protein